MFNPTPFFPDFSLPRRRTRSVLQDAAAASLDQLSDLFNKSIGPELYAKTSAGPKSRQRIFTLPIIFWAFLSQILSPRSSCRQALRKFCALFELKHNRHIDPDTSAYCQARLRLPLALLDKIALRVVTLLQKMTPESNLWCQRVVKVVDGTTLSMPDTPANQKRWPQPSSP